MKLHDPNMIGFDGSPVTGRVQPKLRVDGGVELTREQTGAVMHAYKLFRDAVRVSITGYQVANRTLLDGTKVRMESIQDQDTVYVWPANTKPKKQGWFRGFVESPMFVTGTPAPPALDVAILTATTTKGKWTGFMPKYIPGEKRKALRYKVDVSSWPVKSKSVEIPAKNGLFKFFAGKLVKGIEPLSTEKLNDVFCVHGKRLYKNAIPVHEFSITPPATYPAVFGVGTGFTAAFIGDAGVAGINSTPALQVGYDWIAFVNTFITPGRTFVSGVEVVGATVSAVAQYRANFIAYNITSPGAVQTKIATVRATAAAPFAAVELEQSNQLNVAGILNDYTGFTTTTAATPTQPILGTDTAASHWIGFECSYSDGLYTGPTVSTQWIATAGPAGSNVNRSFAKTHSQPEVVKLNGTENISIARSATISTQLHEFNFGLTNTWPYDLPLVQDNNTWQDIAGGHGPADIIYTAVPQIFQGADLPKGTGMNAGYNELGSIINSSDTGVCKITIPGVSLEIYDVTIDHAFYGDEAYIVNHEGVYSAALGVGINASYPWRKGFINKYASGYGTINRDVSSSVGSKNETHTMSAVARDYIFSDRANGVFVFIETTILSTSSNMDADIGSSSVEVKARIVFSGAAYSRTLYSAAFTTPRQIPLAVPWGIVLSSRPYGDFDYASPQRPAPIYAPLWQDQGLCPHIAYTTASEGPAGAALSPRIAAFFRLQLIKTIRGIEEAGPPTVADAITFPPFMCEQLMSNCGVQPGTVFAALEAAPTIISLASHGGDLFTNIGAPDDEATEYAYFYRT